jgi:hypothetical protein
MPLIIGIVVLVGAFGWLLNTTTGHATKSVELRNFERQAVEKLVLREALQAAVVNTAIVGGARHLQQDFPEYGLRVHVLSRPENMTAQPYTLVRLWATARPLPGGENGFETNNNLAAAVQYDVITRLMSTVRFIEKQRS